MIDTPREDERASSAPEAENTPSPQGQTEGSALPDPAPLPPDLLPERFREAKTASAERKGYTILLWIVVALLTGAIAFVIYHVLTVPPLYPVMDAREPLPSTRTSASDRSTPPSPPVAEPSPAATAAPAPAVKPDGAAAPGDSSRLSGAADAGAVAPSFDVIRVEKDGAFVLAGKAVPGSTVHVSLDDVPFGSVVANARGEWVLAPDKGLPPGNRLLRATVTPPGGTPLQSSESLLIFVPLPGEDAEVLAVVQSDDARIPVRVLQGAGTPPAPGEPGIASLDHDGRGQLVVHGTAGAGEVVRLYIDTVYKGQTTAGPDGRWTFALSESLTEGSHTLRVDRLSADGRTVEARVETRFDQSAPLDETDDRVFVVRPGNNLWNLARRVYGKGWRYTVIFEANRDQIRDPDLIYPGQKLRLPPTGEHAGSR